MTQLIHSEIRKTKLRFLIASLLLLIAAIALSNIWNRTIKEELASQATSFIRKGILSTDLRGVVEVLNGVQFSSFENVTLYRANGERVITLPPVMDYRERSKNIWRGLFFDTIQTKLFLDSDLKEKIGTLEFSYFRLGLIQYAVLVWLVALIFIWILLGQATKKVVSEVEKELKIRHAESVEEIAKKVRHNIRSPLAVLNALFIHRDMNQNEFFEQGYSAVKRLEEIVSEIKSDFQTGAVRKSATPPLFEISKVVSRIVMEKKMIAGLVQIDLVTNTGLNPVYCELPGPELRATLSNIIDNSLQAIHGAGRITVSLICDEHSVEISVADTGHGMPESILPRVFDKEFSYGKKGGTGLGLFYAKQFVEGHQGNISMESLPGEGARLLLLFPRSQTPAWHVDRLDVSSSGRVVTCDDHPGIHTAWESRFRYLKEKMPIHFSFGSCEEIPADVLEGGTLFLLDYDLGSGRETGLDLVARLKQPGQVILVTGNYDAPEIQEACARSGCKLLPKDEISLIEIA